MRQLSFRSKLLLGITTIVFVVFFVLAFTFYNYYSEASLDNELLVISHSNERLNNQIDTLINQMSMSSLYITKTEFLRDILNEFYSNPTMPDYEAIGYYGQLRAQMNILTYYFPNASNVTLFNAEKGFYFQTGLPGSKELVNDNLYNTDWYDTLHPKENNLRIIGPHQDYWVSIKRPVISIIRRIDPNAPTDFGLLEFDIPYWNLENICNNNIRGDSQTFIFDDQGTLIYPYFDTFDYKSIINNYNPEAIYQSVTKSDTSGSININNKLHTYSYNTSDFTHWTTLIVHYPESLVRSKRLFFLLFTIFALVLLTAIIIAFSIIIKSLTKPLYELVNNIRDVNIDNLNLDISNIESNELLMLNQSFNKMFTELRTSINDVYESKIRESNARFLALQSQINPHFIHNTLSVISASAERYGATEPTIICDKLSKMLRYTSSSTIDLVPLTEEINHTINYIELVKLQYTDFDNPTNELLRYTVVIPDEMKRLHVPKMILQPLVENSINHGFNESMPPWQIDIKCTYHSNTHWSIAIVDNGGGFDSVSLATLINKLETYSNNLVDGKLQQNSQIGGMGILNTFSRLKILYPNSFNMYLSNNLVHGASCQLSVYEKGE